MVAATGMAIEIEQKEEAITEVEVHIELRYDPFFSTFCISLPPLTA